MILGRNVEQDQRTCCVQEWQLCLSYFWRYLPLLHCTCMSDSDYPLISCQLCKSKTLWNSFMILGRNVEQDRRRVGYKNDNSAFLTFGVISLCIFNCDNPLISCPLCKSKTLWNIFMILGKNVEQDQTACLVQEWQLSLSYFWRYLPFLCLTVILHWFRVGSVSQRPFGIFLWYLVEM